MARATTRRHTSDRRDRELVQRLRDAGQAQWQIRMMFPRLTKDFIHRWWHRPTTQTIGGRGRPSFASPERQAELYTSIKKKRFANAITLTPSVINPKSGEAVCPQTIRNYMKNAGGEAVKLVRSFYLTDHHRERRCAFAERNKATDWQQWVFSDESIIRMGGVRSCDWVWHDADEGDFEERYVGVLKHPDQVMVWGAISYHGRTGLHFHEGIVDSETYQDCLDEAFMPARHDKEYLGMPKKGPNMFQQDGASCHFSKSTTMYLDSQLGKAWNFTGKGDWPANSPDLNVIENMWAVLKNRVIKRQCTNMQDFVTAIEEEWWSIPQKFIQGLFDSMERRLVRLKANNGGRFKRCW